MVELYRSFCVGPDAPTRMLTVYIEEAHPRDGWYLPHAQHPAHWRQPRSTAERLAIARAFVADFAFPCPFAVDPIDGGANKLFDAWPERLVVIDDGVVIYRSGEGPFHYNLPALRTWLEARYGAHPRADVSDRAGTIMSSSVCSAK